NILVENPAIGSGETTPYHQTVYASIETKSPWPPLVHFLYDVQRPDAFIVFENVNLAIDGSDPTMMRGKFKIARWFAPEKRKKKYYPSPIYEIFTYADVRRRCARSDLRAGGGCPSTAIHLRSLLKDGGQFAVCDRNGSGSARGDARFCKRSLRGQRRPFTRWRFGNDRFDFR